jgi:hypothetical protein
VHSDKYGLDVLQTECLQQVRPVPSSDAKRKLRSYNPTIAAASLRASLLIICHPPEDRGLLLAIAEVLRSNPEAAQWMAERAGRYDLPAILSKVLGEIANRESDS